MSDYDPRDPHGRGEPPLAFDARRPPPRESRPAPIALLVSAFVLVALIVAIAIFYFSGQRDGAGNDDLVGAPVGDMKAAPPDAAQPSDPAAGLQIYKSDEPAANAAPPTFTPPPEEPAPRVPPPTPPVDAGSALPPAAPAPAAPPSNAASPPPAKAPPPATPAPKPAPAPTPKTPAPAPAPAPAPSTGGGSASVQIGAVSSQAAADAAWNEAARVAPGLAAGKGKSVQAIERDGKTLYRTAVTGFSSRAEAAAFCDTLKAAGKSCFVR